VTVLDLAATRALVEKAQVGRLVAATTGARGINTYIPQLMMEVADTNHRQPEE